MKARFRVVRAAVRRHLGCCQIIRRATAPAARSALAGPRQGAAPARIFVSTSLQQAFSPALRTMTIAPRPTG